MTHSGREVWSILIDVELSNPDILVNEGHIFIVFRNSIRKLRADDGVELARVDLTDVYLTSICYFENNLYIVGNETSEDDQKWFMTKMSENLQTYWTKYSNLGSGSYHKARDVAVDDTGLYVAGIDHQVHYQWRMEKRSLSGDLIWVQTLNSSHGHAQLYSIEIDHSGVYLSGTFSEESGTSTRIEKRTRDTGQEIWVQTVNEHGGDELEVFEDIVYFADNLGIIKLNSETGEIIDERSLGSRFSTLGDMKVTSSYSVYLVGRSGSSWQVEKNSFFRDGLAVEGDLRATGAKSFAIPHPLNPGATLVHACLEGPEAGVYYRGEGSLLNGTAEILLPDYFESLTRPEGRTVILSQVDGADPIYTESNSEGALIEDGRFIVKSTIPNSSQRFVWEVRAVRADVPELAVEQY